MADGQGLEGWGRRAGAGLRLAAVAACVALSAGCHKAPPAGPRAVDQPAASVDGQTIYVSDVRREAVAQGLASPGQPLDPGSDLFHQVLDEMVDQKLLAAEALKQKLDRDPGVGRRLAAAREQVLGDALVQREVSQTVNDRADRSLYAEQVKHARQGEELHARQIVVASEADALSIRKLLSTGAQFQMLAMDRSIDPNTRFNGGDLGYFTLDVMPPAYRQVLSGAKVGDVVGPFQVEGGYALVKIEDRRAQAPMSLAQARPQIVRFLTYDHVRDMLERLRSTARIKVLVARRPQAAAAPAPHAEIPTPMSALPGALPEAGRHGAEPAPAAAERRP
jgi:peptidyl-prolyl cis-trans isomerase C